MGQTINADHTARTSTPNGIDPGGRTKPPVLCNSTRSHIFSCACSAPLLSDRHPPRRRVGWRRWRSYTFALSRKGAEFLADKASDFRVIEVVWNEEIEERHAFVVFFYVCDWTTFGPTATGVTTPTMKCSWMLNRIIELQAVGHMHDSKMLFGAFKSCEPHSRFARQEYTSFAPRTFANNPQAALVLSEKEVRLASLGKR
jgi:hypothetical protein